MSQHAAPVAARPLGRLLALPGIELLRLSLRIDAAVTGANGLAYLALAGALDGPLGIEATVLRPVGAFLLIFGLVLWVVAARPRPLRGAVRAVIDANALWAAGSIVVLVAGWLSPTTLGGVWIAMQALVVAGFAGMQYAALRRPVPGSGRGGSGA